MKSARQSHADEAKRILLAGDRSSSFGTDSDGEEEKNDKFSVPPSP